MEKAELHTVYIHIFQPLDKNQYVFLGVKGPIPFNS